MMTRKHYIAIAAAIMAVRATAGDREHGRQLDRLTDELSTVLKEDNPRFDRDRFMSAAGYGGWSPPGL